MADTPHKKPESHKPHDEKEAKEHEGHRHEAPKHAPKPHAAESHKEHKAEAPKHENKPKAVEAHKEHKKEPGKAEKKTGGEKKSAEAQRRVEGKTSKSPAKKGAKPPAKKAEPAKIVDQPTEKYVPNAKPTLTPEQKAGLSLRRTLSGRRPWFRRQQWYEYKKLADSGWRRPTGVDSAQRRHFGYEQSVVRVGFGGPKSVRGLHPSGFREVFVDQIEQLKAIDVKTHAARISGRLGARKLKLIYAEAEKLGVRVLNRKVLQ